jgi:hypothetical protein
MRELLGDACRRASEGPTAVRAVESLFRGEVDVSEPYDRTTTAAN